MATPNGVATVERGLACEADAVGNQSVRPGGACRNLPRSDYTEQPRALALGYAWCEIRPESIPNPAVAGCNSDKAHSIQ
jgi:hypothetical protein